MSDPFVYAEAVANIGVTGSHVAVVPAGITDRGQLFGQLIKGLNLPDYFGENWDALSDCLRDLSWIDGHRVVLFHEALPELGDDGLTTYVELLRDAVLDWRKDENDELVVALPPSAHGQVARLLGPIND